MFIWFVVMALIVFADQLAKYLTVLYLKPIDTQPLLRNVLHLTYVENRGAAFGMLSDSRWVFMVISTVAILGLIVYFVWKKPESRWVRLALSFIIAGGLGNMIDRCVLGYVVDMIDFRLINFAVFNVADSFVCVGAGILMVWLIAANCKELRAEKEAKAAGATVQAEAFDAETVETTDATAPEAVEATEATDADAPAGDDE